MENINWLEEVTQRKEALLKDLFRLLAIPSVREDDKASEAAPVGPGPLKALETFMTMAEEDGFKTHQFGPWAGRIEIGSGEELMGILGHVDVVPPGSGWERDPFEPVLLNDRIYARGSSDDKGPTVGAYFAIKLLRELGHTFNKRVHLIVGTDEESGWQCMDYYFKHAEMPDFGFSPDAEFPIINGEKGNVSARFRRKSTQAIPGDFHLIDFKAGLRPNMVPESAHATMSIAKSSNVTSSLPSQFADFLNQEGVKGHAQFYDHVLELELIGKSAHGSTPEKGINAATYLAKFLSTFAFDQQDSQDFIQILAHELYQGFDGSNVGVAYTHPVMGAVSMNIGIANYTAETGITIDANFRFPEGTDPDTMHGQLITALQAYTTLEITMSDAKAPHYVPAEDPLVQTLLDVYHRQTGLEAHERSIGGGTYGRLMPRGVAYGALFPDSIDTMHQANEFLAVDDLLKATAIYAEAIYRLTK